MKHDAEIARVNFVVTRSSDNPGAVTLRAVPLGRDDEPEWGESRAGFPFRVEISAPMSRNAFFLKPHEVEEINVHALVLDERWELQATYRRTGAGAKLEKLSFRPVTDDPDVLGANMLRRLRLGAVVDDLAALLKTPMLAKFYFGPGWMEQPLRPGRAGTDPLFYAEWAERYLRALEEAPTRPVAHLIEQSEEHLTPAQVRAYLNKARSRGLLTKAEPGRAGGELTKRGKAVLAARDAALTDRGKK